MAATVTGRVTDGCEHSPGPHRLGRAAGPRGSEEARPSLPAGPCVRGREEEEGLQELVSAASRGFCCPRNHGTLIDQAHDSLWNESCPQRSVSSRDTSESDNVNTQVGSPGSESETWLAPQHSLRILPWLRLAPPSPRGLPFQACTRHSWLVWRFRQLRETLQTVRHVVVEG